MGTDILTRSDLDDTLVPEVSAMATQDVRQARNAFLQALQTRKRELTEELRSIDAQIRGLQSTQVPLTGPRRRGPRQGESIRVRVEQLLQASPSPLYAGDIVDTLRAQGVTLSEKDPRAVVVTAARRLVKEGKAQQTGPNTFEAVKD